MRFEFDGIEYRIRFSHEQFYPPLLRAGIGDAPVREIVGRTFARLERHSPDPLDPGSLKWAVAHEGMSMCSVFDHYKKETGRLIALRRLTELLSKELRRVVWEVYTNRKRSTA